MRLHQYGIYKTTNGGTTWPLQLESTGSILLIWKSTRQ